jgi:hypothetical protein
MTATEQTPKHSYWASGGSGPPLSNTEMLTTKDESETSSLSDGAASIVRAQSAAAGSSQTSTHSLSENASEDVKPHPPTNTLCVIPAPTYDVRGL